MATDVVRPELALHEMLKANLDESTDVLFTVAYLDLAGVDTIREVLAERLERKRFRIRVLFRATDLRADPAALDGLLSLANEASGTLVLRYSKHPKFHAKAFGFRPTRAARPTIILGSANMLAAALSPESGELGVILGRGSAADEAWDVMEDFWDDGKNVTPKWLAKYRASYEAAREKSNAANKVVSKWAKEFRKRRRSFHLPDLTREPFYVYETELLDRETAAKAERAAKAAKSSGVEAPDGYDVWEKEPHLPRDRNILESFKSRRGRRVVRLVRLDRVIRAADPKSKTKFWLLYFIPARGGRLDLKVSEIAKNERKLAKLGLAWRDIEGSGYLKGRKERFVRALHALGWPRSRKPG